MLECHGWHVWTHRLILSLFRRDLDVRFAPTILLALAVYPIQDVEQGLLLRAVSEIGTPRVEVLHRTRLVEGYDRWLRDTFLLIPQS